MSDPEWPDWYLQDWMRHLEKIQASLVNELGWNKSRANMVWHGKQPYTRAMVGEIASWLRIEPFELLMPPAEALQLRQLRQAALTIAAQITGATLPEPAPNGRQKPPRTRPTAKSLS